MAGTVTINTPSAGAAFQSASNTGATYMGLTQDAAESDARVGALEARSRLTEEMIEAQQFENVVRLDERQRLLDERVAAVDWDSEAFSDPGGERGAAQTYTEQEFAKQSPEMRAHINGVKQRAIDVDAARKDRDGLLSQWQNNLDDPNARLRDGARAEVEDALERLGQWDPDNPTMGMSPDDFDAEMDRIQAREFDHFDTIDQKAEDKQFIHETFGPGPERRLAKSMIEAGYPREDAFRAAAQGDPMMSQMLQTEAQAAAEAASKAEQYEFVKDMMKLAIEAGVNVQDDAEWDAFMQRGQRYTPGGGGGPQRGGGDGARGKFDARIADLAGQGKTRAEIETILREEAGGGKTTLTKEQAAALPTDNKPKDMPAKEYKGILTRMAEAVRDDPALLIRNPAATAQQSYIKGVLKKAGVKARRFADDVLPGIEADFQEALKVLGIKPAAQPDAPVPPTAEEGIPAGSKPLSNKPLPGIWPPPAPAGQQWRGPPGKEGEFYTPKPLISPS